MNCSWSYERERGGVGKGERVRKRGERDGGEMGEKEEKKNTEWWRERGRGSERNRDWRRRRCTRGGRDQQMFQAESVACAHFCREEKYFSFEILNEDNETSGSC